MPRSNKKKPCQKVPLPAGPSRISAPQPKRPQEPPPKPTSKKTRNNENQQVALMSKPIKEKEKHLYQNFELLNLL